MFNKFIADLLTSYLGEYFADIDREQVKVSIWNGKVNLRNLKVRQDALHFIDLPVCVLMGTIAELTIVIPWTHLRSESVVVQIHNARLILSDKETGLYDLDQEKREERVRKERELKATDDALLIALQEAQLKEQRSSAPSVDTAAGDNSSDNNFTARLKATILNNIRVEISQLFVHYTSSAANARSRQAEDDAAVAATDERKERDDKHDLASPTATAASAAERSSRPASLSFQIREMKACGCNDRFEPAFVAPGERISRQLLTFRGLAVSLRTGQGKETEAPLLHPFDVSVEVAYQPVLTELTMPQYMIALRMEEPCACVFTSEACTTCHGLLGFLQHVRERQAWRRLRPIEVRPNTHARQWWAYALDAVRQQVQKKKSVTLASVHKPTPFSWATYTKTKKKRDRYAALYLRRQRSVWGATRWLQAITPAEHAEATSLEEELPIEILKLAKRLAMERAKVERVEYEKLVREKKAAAATSTRSGSPSSNTSSTRASMGDPSPAATGTTRGVGSPSSSIIGSLTAQASGGSGWFSFWRSAPQPAAATAGEASGNGDDDLDEETRNELVEMVQLMTAERWTDAQRTVIAQEFGISAEEAKELAQSGVSDGSLRSNSSVDKRGDGSSSEASGSGRSPASKMGASRSGRGSADVPRWVVFVHVCALSVELQSSSVEAQALHGSSAVEAVTAPSSAPVHEKTLAKVLLVRLQGGTEWGVTSGSTHSALPAAHYWVSVDMLSITAAKFMNTTTATSSPLQPKGQPQTLAAEQEVLTICQPAVTKVSNAPPAVPAARASAARQRAATFSPLEACWSALSEECRRRAAVQAQWTQRSAQQRTSHLSAVHRVQVGVAPLQLIVDVAPLRHLMDFFFTVMWPSRKATQTAPENVTRRASTNSASEWHQVDTAPATPETTAITSTTALRMPNSRPITHIEERCANDPAARLIILRRRVERQHSIEWDVVVESATVLLSEIPDVQGCEVVATKLRLHNDIEHRLQRQECLQNKTGDATGDHASAATLGASDTDWLDFTNLAVASTRLSVFLPIESSPTPERKGGGQAAPAPPTIVRRDILSETAFAAVVERNLLGRCLPDKPRYALRITSTDTVRLSWCRSSLSVLTTTCSLLTDLGASLGETLLQRGDALPISTADGTQESTHTFHVGVAPHIERKKHWQATDLESHHEEGEAGDNSAAFLLAPLANASSTSSSSSSLAEPRTLDMYYKQMHPFSAARLRTSTGSSAAATAPRRVDVCPGVCVVYHPDRATFPAEYYTLQRSRTRVRCVEGVVGAEGHGQARSAFVQLFVTQGGADHEEVLTDAHVQARKLLEDTLQLPPALLGNAVWLRSTVEAWLDKMGKPEVTTDSEPVVLPSPAQIREALALAVKATHLVPCRYVEFQCTTMADAKELEAALVSCAVADTASPPLELTPAVQAQYNKMVVPAALRKQAVCRIQLAFPSLRLTCEGAEPGATDDDLPSASEVCTSASSPRPTQRRDTVISLKAFGLCYDRHAEKQRFDITATEQVELYAAAAQQPLSSASGETMSNAKTDSANHTMSLVSIVKPLSSAPDSETAGDVPSSALSLRLVLYKRPQPLPSMKRCAILIDSNARVKAAVGPALLESVEAWWDTVGLVTNRLLSEEIILGYPWWSLGDAAAAASSSAAAAAWCAVPEYGGNMANTILDFTAPCADVTVAVPAPVAEQQAHVAMKASLSDAPANSAEVAVLHFVSRGVSLQWRLTESLNYARIAVHSPALRWRAEGRHPDKAPLNAWVDVMTSGEAAAAREGALNLEWQLHRQPPMLSVPDWVCSEDSSSNEDGQGAAKLGDAKTTTNGSPGFRARQELEVRLGNVTLLYWHPLLMRLLRLVQEEVLPRAIALVQREPCWFHDGTLTAPPLSWPPRHAPRPSAISWVYLHKVISLQEVVVQLPEELNWMQKPVLSVPLPCASTVFISALHLTDSVSGRSGSARHSRLSKLTVNDADGAKGAHPVCAYAELTHTIAFSAMRLCRNAASSALSSDLCVDFPSWSIAVSMPLFQASSVWSAREPWPKTFHAHFPRMRSEPPSRWNGTCADLAVLLNFLHASYVTNDQATQMSTAMEDERLAKIPRADSPPVTLLKSVVDTPTWAVDIDSAFQACVTPPPADASSAASCVLLLSGAHVVVARNVHGELKCTLDTQQLHIGSSNSVARPCHMRQPPMDDAVTLLSFPVDATSTATPPRLRILYGWRRLNTDAAKATSAHSKAVFAKMELTHGVFVYVNSTELTPLFAILQSEPLRGSFRRYMPPSSPSSQQSDAAATTTGWGMVSLQAQLPQLELGLLCSPESPMSAIPTAAPARPPSSVYASFSDVAAEFKQQCDAWRGSLQVGRLVHCVLRATDVDTVSTPLLLEQPVGWTPPVPSSPPTRDSKWAARRAADALSSPTQQTMDTPKPSKDEILDELFGDLPSSSSTAVSPAPQARPEPSSALSVHPSDGTVSNGTLLTVNADPNAQSAAQEQTKKKWLHVEVCQTNVRSSFAVQLQPLWLIAPSMAHTTLMLTGVRQQVHRLAHVFRPLKSADASTPMAPVPPPGPAEERTYAIDVQCGPISVFVVQPEVVLTHPLHSLSPRHVETAVSQALSNEALLIATEAAIIQWDSQADDTVDRGSNRDGSTVPAVQRSASPQTVLLLRNTSICAMRGLGQCTGLLKQFGIRVTRQRSALKTMADGASDSNSNITINSGGGEARSETIEEWQCCLDPLQLTLSKLHYAALLRVALQQTSLLTTMMSSASSASHSLAAAAITDDGSANASFGSHTGATHLSRNAAPPSLSTSQSCSNRSKPARSFRLQMSSLNLRVEDDAAAIAVYVRLKQLDAVYYTKQKNLPLEAQNTQRRCAVSLVNCMIGTEGAIPTFSLAASSSQPDKASCAVRITQDALTKVISGSVNVKQVTVTVEAIPMMAWVDLLYAPYLQVAVPHHQVEKEYVMQRDWWLTEDVVLSEMTPLRVVNKEYRLLYLYGNGRTIYLHAPRRGQLIFLDEGMTLRIMNAILCVDAESIEQYVAAGDGSYVVVDRESCTVLRPGELMRQSRSAASAESAGTPDPRSPLMAAPSPPMKPLRSMVQWHRFEGELQVQVRIPEPRGVSSTSVAFATPNLGDVHASTAGATSGAADVARSAQQTLVLYSNMRLGLMNTPADAATDAAGLAGQFDLTHAGVRSESVTAQGVTIDTADLISDWATQVLYVEERAETGGDGFRTDGSPVSRDSFTATTGAPGPGPQRQQQRRRTVQLNAESGVEIRLHYSDVFFVLRAARHAQTALAKWKNVLRRGVWSNLSSSLQGNWSAEAHDLETQMELTAGGAQSGAFGSRNPSSVVLSPPIAASTPPSSDSAPTVTSVVVQVPYVSFIAVDDSQDNDTPLFCLYVSEIRTPACSMESPQFRGELQFVVQLDYYNLARSQWAPMLDPLKVGMALNWRRNRSILDVYNRKGFLRIATQASSVKFYFSLELLRNLRQLQLLRAKFVAAGVEVFKATAATTSEATEVNPTNADDAAMPPPQLSTTSFHAFKMRQTTGVDVAVELPEYVAHPREGRAYRQLARASSASLSSMAATTHVLASGTTWEFNLPRSQGRELPREQQKIMVQPRGEEEGTMAHGAVVSVAAVGVQRAPLSYTGLLQRYILADVSVLPQQQGQKQVYLHTTILFQNELNASLVQLAAKADASYEAIDVVPSGASQYVSVLTLRRRVCLALSVASGSTEGKKSTGMQPGGAQLLSPDSVVSLGVSYDALPCLTGTAFLCVCDAVPGGTLGMNNSRGGATSPILSAPPSSALPLLEKVPPQTLLAKGKNFDVVSGRTGKSFFLLRVQAAADQPSDVVHYPALAPLRAVVVTAEAAVMLHNQVGLPISVTLMTRRVRPGMRLGILDASPDTTLYTAVSAVSLPVNERYGATEMDPLEEVCVSVSLQQPNGSELTQWSPAGTAAASGRGGAGNSRGAATAFHAPACIYSPLENGRRDSQVVLTDPASRTTLVLYIKYTKRDVLFYCPQWIVNETDLFLQFADTSSPHFGESTRCTAPIAGLAGRTVSTATVSPWEGSPATAAAAPPSSPPGATDGSNVFLYHSLRAESCSNNRNDVGGNGLFVRVWEAATAAGGRSGFSEWSHTPLSVHEVDEMQVITCASRQVRGAVLVVSCRVELGSQTRWRAYSGTRVISLRPRWVLLNKSPYTLCFAQNVGNRGPTKISMQEVKPFSETPITTLARAASESNGFPSPLFSFYLRDDAARNIQQCCWSSSVSINAVHEESSNLVYHSLVPLSEYWPQTSAEMANSTKAAQCILDSLPPLQPEDIKEIDKDLFVDREDTKVFTTTAYSYKGCMMCVEVEEAAQPPIIIENRTSYTVRFRQRGVRRVSTVFPRCSKAWTWDAPTASPSTPAMVELWLALGTDAARGSDGGGSSVSASPRGSCMLNFDPQQIGQQSRNVDLFQKELEVEDSVRGLSTMLFVRVRGVHGVSYAVSITTEPTIDAFRTLPFPQLSLALQVESVYALLAREATQNMLLCCVKPLSFTFAQGIRQRKGDGGALDAIAPGMIHATDSSGGDVQRVHLRFSSFQVDDERPAAAERVVAQLVDDRESGFQLERKLLRTTPLLYCSVVALRLTPVELHIEDTFITAMMQYQEVLRSAWESAWPPAVSTSELKKRRHGAAAHGAVVRPPAWRTDLTHELHAARDAHVDAKDGSVATAEVPSPQQQPPRTSVPLWSRVIVMDQLSVDPILVSLSLYRSPGAVDDPLWKIAGAASLLVGSTKDARLQWDAVQRRRVCDTIWHLCFVHGAAYKAQLEKQYMSLINVMGLDTMRNFVSDLLNVYGEDGRDSASRGAGRRQKPRVSLRRAANFSMDAPVSTRRQRSRAEAAADQNDSTEAEASANLSDTSMTTDWVRQASDRQVSVNAVRLMTISEVARAYPLNVFFSLARPNEWRAFGGLAYARVIAEMPLTPRHTLRITESSVARRLRAQDVVKSVSRAFSAASTPSSVAGTAAASGRVQCTRCAELDELREQRLRDNAATPLPHPTREGFMTWEEFAHHVNWYEFLEMCTDEEVRTYAPLVHEAATEASRNVCILKTA